MDDEIIVVQKLQKCYKLSSKGRKFNSLRGHDRSFKIEFGQHLTQYDLPPRVIIYVTSEANSYGAEIDKYTDGVPFFIEIDLNHQATVLFKPKKMQYSKEIRTGCGDKSVWELSAEVFLNEVYDYCPDPCTPMLLPNVEMVPCFNHSNFMVMCCFDIFFYKALPKVLETYTQPCSTLEYEGKILEQSKIKEFEQIVEWTEDIWNSHLNYDTVYPDWATKWEKNPTVIFSYRFDNPEMMTVYGEFIVVTFDDLIGIIGGTLSMFIGFAFYDFILDALEFLLKSSSKIIDFYNQRKATQKNTISPLIKRNEPETTILKPHDRDQKPLPPPAIYHV